jgi:hypothetical protein
MYLDLFNNLSLNRFMINFNKLSNTMSPVRQSTHQDSNSTNAFSTPLGTQRNGEHFFLRRKD